MELIDISVWGTLAVLAAMTILTIINTVELFTIHKLFNRRYDRQQSENGNKKRR